MARKCHVGTCKEKMREEYLVTFNQVVCFNRETAEDCGDVTCSGRTQQLIISWLIPMRRISILLNTLYNQCTVFVFCFNSGVSLVSN